MRAWLLGSGGWMPNGARETTCVLVRDGAHALILDAGTGLRRLVMRIGDRLALITDTAFDPGSIAFARDVEHLLHEAWFAETGDEGDASASEAARVAREANARRLTLVHLDPRADDPDALLAHAPGATVGRDELEL